ncbi:MAG: hypothetical protein HYW25_05610 [Candidatus Aenigmarchaeota archaeon]|nr:hypothetical protein [Candidatus Aenigmarchaeota archaeon]
MATTPAFASYFETSPEELKKETERLKEEEKIKKAKEGTANPEKMQSGESE